MNQFTLPGAMQKQRERSYTPHIRQKSPSRFICFSSSWSKIHEWRTIHRTKLIRIRDLNSFSPETSTLMSGPKKEHPKSKSELHPRNRHRDRYDFKKLIGSYPELGLFVRENEYGDDSIDFFDPQAVLSLNKALLKHFYQIDFWDIPKNYLCPPIPGRADYIHYVADLLAASNNNTIPRGQQIKCLDVGVGANCIYPIIGVTEYDWLFVGTDVDPLAIESAKKITEMNPALRSKIALRLQQNTKQILQGVIQKEEQFHLTICNPPFHASAEEAEAGTLRKLSNLKRKKMTKPVLNFGGKSHELWREGGEEKFVSDMINESKQFDHACLWFTTLISKSSSLDLALAAIKNIGAAEVQIIPMSQGNKSSRILAWTFFTPQQRSNWFTT
jgi:23S rRNA (adenine1618-N6)-methyltransferase